MNTVFQQILDLGTGEEAEQGDKEINGNKRAIDLTDGERACPNLATIQVQQTLSQVPADTDMLRTILDTVSRKTNRFQHAAICCRPENQTRDECL